MKSSFLLAALVAMTLGAAAQSQTVWTYETEGRFVCTPALFGQILLAGSSGGQLHAVDVATGAPRWRFTAAGPIGTEPCIAGGTAVFGSYDGHYYGVDAATGAERWRFRTGGERRIGARGLWSFQPAGEYMEDPYDFFLSSPATDGQTVFFGSSDSCVYALHAATGALRWKFRTGGPVHGGAACSGNTVVIGSWDTYVYALDASTGQLKWKFKTGTDTVYHGVLQGIQARPAITEGKVFIGARDAKFRAIDLRTGQPIWTYDGGNAWISGSAVVLGDRVLVGTSDSYLLLALDAATGKEIAANKGGGYVFGAPAASAKTVAYADFTGRVYLLDAATLKVSGIFETPGRRANAPLLDANGAINFELLAAGAPFEKYATTLAVMDKLYRLGPFTAAPLITGKTVVAAGNDGTIYAIPLP